VRGKKDYPSRVEILKALYCKSTTTTITAHPPTIHPPSTTHQNHNHNYQSTTHPRTTTTQRKPSLPEQQIILRIKEIEEILLLQPLSPSFNLDTYLSIKVDL
jgi:hypothetical protein